jgi:prepilin signal peptidase PulO-like enzyme (type II secretory pathway)
VFETLSGWPGWTVPLVVGYAAFLIGISVYDVRRHRIPNVAVYPAILVALGVAFVRPDGMWWTFVLSGLGAAAFFMVLGTVSAGGMGMGDAKLAALIGLVAGWPAVVVAIFVAFALGAVAGVLLMAVGRLGRRDPLPFAPALAVGAATAAVAGRQLAGLIWPGVA